MAQKRRGRKPKKELGDKVEQVAKAIGADKIAKAFEEATGKDCGCDKRKEILNKAFRTKEAGCMTLTQYNAWTELKKELSEPKNVGLINHEQKKVVAVMHAQLFNHTEQKPCDSCGKVYRAWISEIDKIYNTYEA